MNSIDEIDLPNYKLFWVDSKQLKHTVEKFKASCDDDAHGILNEYCTAHTDHKYYYGRVMYARFLSSSGKMCLRELCENGGFIFNDDTQSFLSRAMSAVWDFLCFWLWQKPIDWWYKLKDIVYLLKHGEKRSNQWSLDLHLVDTLELNLPSLIKSSHSLMFLDEAIVKLHGNEDGFDLKTYHEKHYSGYPTDVESLAVKIQHDEYSKLLLNVKLYKYYMDAGMVDTDDPSQVEFDKEWRHTLPVKPGTYDEFDYTKLQKLQQKSWDFIWDWVKKHGHTLYD